MFEDEMAMVKVYGYTSGCEACDKLKDLLWRHNIQFTFIPTGRKTSGCVQRKWLARMGHETVPQVYMDQTYIGDYGTIKNHLEPKEAELNAQPLLGWIPATPPKLSEPPRQTSQTVEEETTGTRTIKEIPEEAGKAEACYINPLTGQKECS